MGSFAKGLEEFLPHRVQRVYIEFLLQVNDAGIPLLDHQAAAGLLEASDDSHLGGLASAVYPHQANAIPWLHFPGDIPQHLAGGIDLANALQP